MIILSLLLTTLTSMAAPQSKLGGGPHAIECPELPVQILDYVEFGSPTEQTNDYREQVTANLERLTEMDEKIGAKLLARWMNWATSTETADGPLPFVNDSANSNQQKGCKLLQLGQLRLRPKADEKVFILDKQLWEGLSNAKKAGVILHQLVYEYFYYLGEIDSRAARRYATFVAKMTEKSSTFKDYQQMVRELKISLYR